MRTSLLVGSLLATIMLSHSGVGHATGEDRPVVGDWPCVCKIERFTGEMTEYLKDLEAISAAAGSPTRLPRCRTRCECRLLVPVGSVASHGDGVFPLLLVDGRQVEVHGPFRASGQRIVLWGLESLLTMDGVEFGRGYVPGSRPDLGC